MANRQKYLVDGIRRKLNRNQPVMGCWLTCSSSLVAEAMASLGFDWLAVDMEHGQADIEQAGSICAVAERHGVMPVVRIPSADPYFARRLLDNGAQGIIVPQVEDPEAFSDFASHCLYPTLGKRGLGLSRANLWGEALDDQMTVFKPLLVPQIETAAGAERASEIATLAAVDAVFLGPYDLSASLGKPGDFKSKAFKSARNGVIKACKMANTPIGYHQVPTEIRELKSRIKEGFTFLAYGTDLTAMREALSGFRDI